MPQLKLGATKKGKRKAGTNANAKPSKKNKVEVIAPKPAVKAKPLKPRNKGSKRTAVDIVHNDERELSDQDIEDFDEYSHFQGFLQNLDPQALAKKVKKQTRSVIAPSQSKARPAAVSKFAATGKGVDEQSSEDVLTGSEDDMSDLETGSEDELEGDFEDVVSEEDSELEGLSGVKSESLTQDSEEEEDVDYESRPRNFKNSTVDSNRLPIKLRDGRVQNLRVETVKEEGDTSLPPETLHMKEEEMSETEMQVEVADEIQLTPAEKLMQTQERLAKVASEIIEDPEENFEQLNKIKEVLQTTRSTEKHYAILTMSAVFMDIIPGYRIRPLTEVEKAEKVTKEVRKLRNFEQTLVHQYHDFVKTLTELTKTSRKATPETQESEHKDVAVRAACSLLKAAPHFNFRIELLNILVNQIAKKNVDEIFVRCRTTIEELFQEDQEGEASFEAMRLLCKKMKVREYQIDQSTLGTFLHLRLLTEMEVRGSTRRVDHERIRKKDRQFRTKKLKKLLKEQKEVEKDMKEAEATVDAETRERLQGETLKLAFTTYFRVLKERNRSIMGAALEGLAKFAHLINVDFFGDLLEVLKELMTEDPTSPDALSTRDTLLCIVTAFTLLSGQGSTKETVSLDLSKFIDQLYTSLLPLAINPDIELNQKTPTVENPSSADNGAVVVKSKVNVSTEAEMLLRALDAVFFKHRVQGSLRLTAFVKRLSTASLHFPERSARGAIELTKRLATRYAKLYSLYSTDDSAGDGTYNGETDNLELCNPAATSVWELALYRTHYSPKVQAAAKELVTVLQEATSNVRS